VFAKLQENGVYIANRLIALGVLLGNGTNEEKAEILFEHCDEDFTMRIERNAFKTLLDDLMHVAIESIPEVGVGKGEGFVVQDQMTTYQTTLRKVRATASNELLDKIFGKSTDIAKDMFVRVLKDGDGAAVTSSHEIRKFCVAVHKRVGDPTLKMGSTAIRNAFRMSMKKPAAAPASTAPTATPSAETTQTTAPEPQKATS
jgi:hypothetical protein